MINGRLGASDLAAAAWTTIYEPTSPNCASTSVNICNRNLGNAALRLAIHRGSGSTPTGGEYVEFAFLVYGHSALERTGVVLDIGDKLVAYSDVANVTVLVYGFEGNSSAGGWGGGGGGGTPMPPGFSTITSGNLVKYNSSGNVLEDAGHTLADLQLRTEKAAANGYASLDGAGKVPTTQMPTYVGSLDADLLAIAALGDSAPTTGFAKRTAADTWGLVAFGSTTGTICQGDDSRLANARTPSAHALIDTTGHTASGLTTGHFLKATGATTYGFAAHGLGYSDVGADAAGAAAAVTPTTLSLVIGTNVQAYNAKLGTFSALADAAGWLHSNGSGTYAWSTPSKADVGLGSVENTALSTWAGSGYITTLGTVTSGSFPAANLSGTTLASGVVSSSLTSVGTLGTNTTLAKTAPVFTILDSCTTSSANARLQFGLYGTTFQSANIAGIYATVVGDTHAKLSIQTYHTTVGLTDDLVIENGLTTLAALTVTAAPTFSALTSGYIPRAGTAGLMGNSVIYSDGTNVGVGTATPTLFKLQTAGHVGPDATFSYDLGAIGTKWRSLWAAELRVETLVAQDVMATIGGRILVGPTTMLTADLAAAATTIHVKHNNLVNGDRVYMSSAPGGTPQMEWLAITSAATAETGGHYYGVTRNLDGSGANDWYAGDAIFSTGTTGNGFIDLYSVSGIRGGAEPGPTIVGNVRNSATYNDYSPRWAIGNLDGLYGYSGATYGAAFGVPSAAWLKIDPTNGIRIGYDTTTKISLSAAGDASFTGSVTAASGSIAAWTITATELQCGTGGVIRSGQTAYNTGTGFWLGNVSTTPKFSVGAAGGQGLTWDGSVLTINGSITLTNTIAAGSVTGLAATATSSDFASVTGTTKPANNATVGATWGTDITSQPTSLSGINSTEGSKLAGIAAGADVTLSAVNGGLSLTGGGLVLTSGGAALRGGQTAYDTGSGFWIGDVSGTTKFSIGNSAGNKLTWDGSALALTGAITAASGAIGGWTIGAAKLSGTGIDLNSGASAGLAFGTTPPTSAAVGTGLWLDKTGLYGLTSNVVNAKFGTDGLTLNGLPNSYTAGAAINIKAGADLVGALYGMEVPGTRYTLLTCLGSPAAAALDSQVRIVASGDATHDGIADLYVSGYSTWAQVRVSTNAGSPYVGITGGTWIDGGLHVGGTSPAEDNNLIVDGTATIASLTSGYLPKAGTAGLMGNSPVYTDGTNVGIGATGPRVVNTSTSLDVAGIYLGADGTKHGVINSADGMRLNIRSTNANSNAFFEIAKNTTAQDGGTSLLYINGGTGNVGIGMSPSVQFELSGAIGQKASGTTWANPSDERLKTNIVLADLQRCYDDIKALPLKRYTLKDDCFTAEQVKDRTLTGFIANDVQKIMPKAVNVIPFAKVTKEVIEDCLNLDVSQIYMQAIGAIQMLQKKIELLEEKK
jgi:hypothetical protein